MAELPGERSLLPRAISLPTFWGTTFQHNFKVGISANFHAYEQNISKILKKRTWNTILKSQERNLDVYKGDANDYHHSALLSKLLWFIVILIKKSNTGTCALNHDTAPLIQRVAVRKVINWLAALQIFFIYFAHTVLFIYIDWCHNLYRLFN